MAKKDEKKGGVDKTQLQTPAELDEAPGVDTDEDEEAESDDDDEDDDDGDDEDDEEEDEEEEDEEEDEEDEDEEDEEEDDDEEDDDEEDDDEEDDDEVDDEDDKDEEEAKTAKAAVKPKARAATAVAEDEDDDEEDDDEEDDDEVGDDEAEEDDEDDDEDEEDPYWWTPHLVLSALLVIGLAGFLGLFNHWLGPLVAASPAPEEHSSAPAPSAPPAAPAKAVVDQRPTPAPAPQAPPAPLFGAKHILVSYKDSQAQAATKRTKDEAKKLAGEISKKVKADHKKWDELVKKYSDDKMTVPKNGELGDFRRGQLVPAFQETVEKLKVGDVSDPVETPFGFHIIWRTK